MRDSVFSCKVELGSLELGSGRWPHVHLARAVRRLHVHRVEEGGVETERWTGVGGGQELRSVHQSWFSRETKPRGHIFYLYVYICISIYARMNELAHVILGAGKSETCRTF